MVKAFIFDWSGVISDDFSVIFKVTSSVMRKLGIRKLTASEFREKFDPTYMDMYRSLGVLAGMDEIGRLFSEEFSRSRQRPKAFPFAKGALSAIKKRKIPCAVLSAHPTEFLEKEIKDYGLERMFSVVVGSASDKAEHIERVIEGLGAPRDEIVYVGDMTHDIETGNSAGVMTAAVLSGYHTREQLEDKGPNFIMKDIRDIKFILEGICA